MKIIKAGYEIMPAVNNNNILQRIEQAGRVCYKSENNITDDSSKTFCANIIKRGHEAVLEHGSFCFEMSSHIFVNLVLINQELENYGFRSFLRITSHDKYLVSANVRAWRDFLKACKQHLKQIPIYLQGFVFEHPILFPEYQNAEYFAGSFQDGVFLPVDTSTLTNTMEILTHRDVTVKFIVDRGVSHEIVRHRTASFCQESTRYCNYGKDKFGNEITVIEPLFWDQYSKEYNFWKGACAIAESDYFSLLKCGTTPQEARSVLPNSLKTEVVMTTNCGGWRHFFELRTPKAAHPQMREVAIPLLKECKKTISAVFDDIEVKQ